VQNGQKEKDGAPRLSYGVSSHVPSCKAELYDELVLKDNKLRERIQSIREAGRETKKEGPEQPKRTGESDNTKLQELRDKIKRVEEAAKNLNKPFYKPER
jgi:predicted RNase H-like nuclease (RuvC/YqgF family)